MDWQRARADAAALGKHTYLNTAGIGITPRPVTAEIQRLFGEWGAQGATTPTFRQEVAALEREARACAARLFGVSTEELAFTGRVAESLHIVTDGLSWRRGDEVITSDEEVIYAPLYRLTKDHGVVIRVMDLVYEREGLLERFAALLTPRTRLVWLSDTTNKSGLHLPTREICEIAHARGALVMYDGAQTAGQRPIDLHEIGCDFYAITGYKWLLGPYGCGLCYVRRDHLPQVHAFRLGQGSVDHVHSDYTEDDTAARFEFGVRNIILRIGFGKALAYMAGLGIEAVWERTMALRDHAWHRLGEIPGACIVGPRDPALSSAITCLVLEGVEPAQLVAEAWRANIVIVPTEVPTTRPDLRGVRIAPAFYNTEEDLERLIDVIAMMIGRRT